MSTRIRPAVDVERVGIWGFSQGGWIGPLAAAASDRVAFLVLIASTGVTPSAQMMYAAGEQLRRGGYDEAVVSRAPLTFLPPTLLNEEECRLWIDEMDFDPRPVFAQVRVPTLLFYGEDDAWTPLGPMRAGTTSRSSSSRKLTTS